MSRVIMVASFPHMASTQPTATAPWRRWRFRGIVLLLVLPVVAAYALVMTGNARADGPGPSPGPSADALGTAGGQAVSDAQATTDQAANAAADAAQEARNVVVSIRVDSPGDDGDISQANTATAGAGATNDASTAQGQGGDPGNGGDVASSLEAAAQQAANAVASAAQQAQNIVISIRINSPGDNGSIGQSNTATANGSAGNTAATNQGSGAASSQAEPANTVDSSSDPVGSVPAQSTPNASPASSPAAAAPVSSGPRTVLPRLIATRPSHEGLARPPAIRPAARRAGVNTASPVHESESASPTDVSGSSWGNQAPAGSDTPRGSAAADAETHQQVSTPVNPSRHSTNSSSSLRPGHGSMGIGDSAASFLRGLGQTAKTQQASGEDISNSVFLALIALLVALPLLLLFRYPDRLRALRRTLIHR
jgi:uncharacterized protein (UPF0333 family)